MLTILKESKDIENAQQKFNEVLTKIVSGGERINIGYQGGGYEGEAFWSQKYHFWWNFRVQKDRYVWSFGTEEPKWGTKTSHGMTCVITIPLQGVNLKFAGVFARDNYGDIYLLHSGRIAGGKKGVSKKAFNDFFMGEWETLQYEKQNLQLALVGSLSSRTFMRDLAWFIEEVARIKQFVTSGVKPIQSLRNYFTPEFSGEREYQKSGIVKMKCNHGPVVKALREKLELMNLKVANNRPIDLYLFDKNKKPAVIFEVETNCSTSSCYEAIGQLLFHSTRLARLFGKKPLAIAVFPSELPRDYIEVLQMLGIPCLTYKWKGDTLDFHNLEFVVKEIK